MKARLDTAGIIPTFLAATMLAAPAASAQGSGTPWHGFYVGGGGNFANVSVEVGDGCYDDYCWWGDYYDYDEGEGAYGYTAHAGYRINPWVAAEVSYLDTGTIRWKENFVYMPEFDGVYNNRVNLEAQVVEVSGLILLPMDNWEVYLRLGAGFWDGTSEQRLDDPYSPYTIRRDLDSSDTGFLAGIGGGVTVGDGWHLRLEFQTMTLDGDVLNTDDDTSLDSVLFEVQYRFGWPRTTAPSQPSAPPTATP